MSSLIDLFVISSVREGLPLVFLEAMAHAVPVLTTNVAGIPGVMEDKKSAVVVEPRSCETLEDNIWFLINNQNLRE
jgi:glycosyltransferase involved in cell wall biosynthesis